MRSILLVCPAALLLMCSSGCPDHKICVRSTTINSYQSRCASRNSRTNACNYYKTVTVPQQKCLAWDCEHGYMKSGSSCVRDHSVKLLSSSGTKAPRRPPVSALRRCRSGYIVGCMKHCHKSPQGSKACMRSFVPNFVRRCPRFLSSCTALGHIYEKGLAGHADLARARHYYALACRKGYSIACSTHKRLTGQNSQMRRMHRRYCHSGTFKHCLKYCQYDPAGVHGCVVNKLLPSLKKECNRGSRFTCELLGKMYYQGLVVRKNLVLARELYARACRLNNKRACTMVKIINRGFPRK